MGMYICNRCQNYRNSDDGCEEDPNMDTELVCLECAEKIDCEKSEPSQVWIDPDLGPTGHGDICWSDADPGL